MGKDKYKLKIQDFNLSAENKGRDFFPLLFLKAFTLGNL